MASVSHAPNQTLETQPDERPRTPRPGSPDPGSCRDHRGGRGRRGGPAEAGRARRDRGGARRRRQAARLELGARRPTPRSSPVAANTDEGRSVIRHSAAHVLAQAVQDLFPQAKLGIGPPITDGFYYDFDVAEPFTPEDLAALEKRMRQIVKDGQLFDRRVYESKDQAREELANEPYKLELVDDKSGDPDVMEVGGDELTAYDNLNPRTRERVWGDLCRGPHIPTTKHIPAFKLTRSSAAYWRGDQKNASLQRIYGTAWESQEALDKHLELIEEAQRRDHRKLGVELDLFSFPDEIGSGLAVFHPKGGIVRAELEDYSRRKHIEAGYEFVNTPHITKAQLLHHVGPPGLVRRGHVPADAPRRGVQRGRHGAQAGPGLLPQADELPDAPPDLPVARPVLSRASVAALRVRHRLPLREVRRGARADPGARHDAGRRAHLLHARADARRAGLAAAVRARPARRLRAGRLLPGAVHQGPGEVRRLRRGVGGGHPGPARGRRGVGAGPGSRPGRRGVLRPEDLGAGQGRAGPQLADVDHPAGLQLAGAFRAGVHRQPTDRGSGR